ncbi:peptidoglycan-binding protein LysM [Bordetella pertussis]|uniref:Membrane protein n=9 Tax=Bordetella TaxID=517 RepID=Q7VT64_BORPE|nr:LysM domain/BON superfamily protein [Bordetella pertussis CS]AIW93896.1 LysM domain/BON superfamily protein [Bordetella pertussis B1917]AIW97356.1 LysM domain/BON superfamily protein [Bordetella pertussis B1920]AJB28204.1 LysM domain/BON superfamily protein [Bordetella pertussis 137]ALH50949.1 LysM domain/BON superfamily protein [Bordetella pertussis]AUL41810.1 peptidoglycan-binding protein LysM [Bordetella parapertussis]AUV49732.1 peptidoglycan-binding protein LysM [Bordetella bronchisept
MKLQDVTSCCITHAAAAPIIVFAINAFFNAQGRKMGLLNFIKEVGEKLFGASEAKAATADELKKELDKHGLSAEGLDISVDGDKVTVKGSAASTEAAEKIVLALGNTVGVAQVDNQLQTAQAAPAAVMYTVQKGDTLWKIAEANYGKGKGAKYPTIFEANKPMLSDPDKIYPGQVLRIPPLAE